MVTVDGVTSHDINSSDILAELVKLLKARKLFLFAGSGISRDSDVPVWRDFLKNFVLFCQSLQNALPPDQRFADEASTALEIFESERSSIPNLIQSVTVLKKRLLEVADNNRALKISDRYDSWLRDQLSHKKPNRNHRAIIKTNYPQIITVNYDTLLEEAALDEGFDSLSLRSYTYNDADLIAAALYHEQTSVIHMHGSMNSPNFSDDLIITMDDYTKLKSNYPGMALLLRNMFTSNSILMVGYGGDDPNIEEVFTEILYALELSQVPQYFILLHKDEVNPIFSHYRNLRRTTVIVYNDYLEVTQFLEKLQAEVPRSTL